MHAGKPIVGVAGGVGSGKSFVARLFGELGCRVISSDELVRDAYRDGRVVATLKKWWGGDVLTPGGEVNKRVVAQRIFADPAERQRLERLLHPMVSDARERVMAAAAPDPAVPAFVWDTPLLFETGLNARCDAVVFVDAPQPLRLARVQASRGWDAGELARRENSQMPLDTKRNLSQYVVENTADADVVRGQVRAVLSRILERTVGKPDPV
ncbi:MAG TPA: dephospho-CoA kinase [Tepidisphaeraceae bacterium]|nr:dephospho-CoA kinase [Tepidisphaeraceae bacterium]